MATLYRKRISALHESLQQEGTRAEAAELVRSLVDQIRLVPKAGALSIVLRGDLAGILAIASSDKQNGRSRKGTAVLMSQVMLVAGTGFEPVTFRL
ncbi:MAG: putative recombinase [Rhodospirillales bacterium]|nr:putative recombinase [Rhodospirillales bacterium]